MIDDTIAKIEKRIESAEALDDAKRAELRKLVSDLRSEINDISGSRASHAESITGFVDVSTHEATREDKNPHLLELAIDGLRSSVEDFEKSHPKLVQTVNGISTILSNLGI